MYEAALLQGQPAANAAEFNTYAFIMLLMGTRQKDGPTAFFQARCLLMVCLSVQLWQRYKTSIKPQHHISCVGLLDRSGCH